MQCMIIDNASRGIHSLVLFPFQLGRRPPLELRECHLRSSNLSSLEGIVVAMETLPQVTSILQPFPWAASPHPLLVDLVCNQGYTWVKVVARKAQAIHLVWAGEWTLSLIAN